MGSTTARTTFGSAYPSATEPSAMVQSRYSLPSTSVTRQPTAWAKCVGPVASAAPYRASMRLLPVDAPVGSTARARVTQSASSCSTASTLSAWSSSTASSSGGALSSASSALSAAGLARPASFAPRSKNRRNGMSGKRSDRETASTPATSTLQVAEHLDRHSAHERDLARVGRGPEGERPQRPHDVLGVARLEELDRGERVCGAFKVLLELLDGRRRRVLARWRERASGIGRGKVQLVEPDERGLGEVEGRVVSRWYGDDRMHAVEDLVRQSAVLAAKDDGDGPFPRRVEELRRRNLRVDDTPLGCAAACGEPQDANAVGNGSVEAVESLDSLDEIHRAVGDALEIDLSIRNGIHQPKSTHAHVLHRADRRGNVDHVLRLVEHDDHGVEERFRHCESEGGRVASGRADRPAGTRTRRVRRSKRAARGAARDRAASRSPRRPAQAAASPCRDRPSARSRIPSAASALEWGGTEPRTVLRDAARARLTWMPRARASTHSRPGRSAGRAARRRR